MLHLIQHTCTNKQYKKTVTHTTPGRPIVTYHTWTTVNDTNTPGRPIVTYHTWTTVNDTNTPGQPIVTYHTWTTVSDTNTPGQLPAAALDQLPEDNADKCIAAHREVEQ